MMLTYDGRARLRCEEVPLEVVAGAAGTPTYVYSRRELLGRARALLRAAQACSAQALFCFAVKANGHPALLRLLAAEGLGADVTSGGELFLARQAGIPPERIIFSGVGKTDGELEAAMDAGIRAIHVESGQEFERLAALAAARRRPVAVGVRLNPDIAVETHRYISTGRRSHKFGLAPGEAMGLLQRAAAHPWLQVAGLAVHVGSQILELAPFRQAVAFLLQVAAELEGAGIRPAYLDVGGGLGIPYREEAPDPAAWVAAVGEPAAAAGYPLVLEPGRSIVGPAGILLTRVVAVKEQGGQRFVVVDAGMNDLIRPALYQAYHPLLLVQEPERPVAGPAEVVGPVCETGDTLASARPLPAVAPGELLAVLQAGAYGFAMSSNYNGRLRPAEVLVDGEQFRLIRGRQTLADLLAGVAW